MPVFYGRFSIAIADSMMYHKSCVGIVICEAGARIQFLKPPLWIRSPGRQMHLCCISVLFFDGAWIQYDVPDRVYFTSSFDTFADIVLIEHNLRVRLIPSLRPAQSDRLHQQQHALTFCMLVIYFLLSVKCWTSAQCRGVRRPCRPGKLSATHESRVSPANQQLIYFLNFAVLLKIICPVLNGFCSVDGGAETTRFFKNTHTFLIPASPLFKDIDF